MRVKLKTRYASPYGNYAEGVVINVPDEEAKQLINGGYALIVDIPVQKEPVKIETADVKPVETAKVKPPHRLNWSKK